MEKTKNKPKKKSPKTKLAQKEVWVQKTKKTKRKKTKIVCECVNWVFFKDDDVILTSKEIGKSKKRGKIDRRKVKFDPEFKNSIKRPPDSLLHPLALP